MGSAIAYKVRVKLGPAEFEAEGPEDTVRQQLDHFYVAVTQPLHSHVRQGDGGNETGKHSNKSSDSTEASSPPELEPGVKSRPDVDPKIIARLFKEKDGVVFLSALPKAEDRSGAALVLILWGYYVLKGRMELTGKELVNSGKLSGINLDRVDETLDKKGNQRFIATGGAGRRRCYSLNNTGMEYATSLAREIFN